MRKCIQSRIEHIVVYRWFKMDPVMDDETAGTRVLLGDQRKGIITLAIPSAWHSSYISQI